MLPIGPIPLARSCHSSPLWLCGAASLRSQPLRVLSLFHQSQAAMTPYRLLRLSGALGLRRMGFGRNPVAHKREVAKRDIAGRVKDKSGGVPSPDMQFRHDGKREIVLILKFVLQPLSNDSPVLIAYVTAGDIGQFRSFQPLIALLTLVWKFDFKGTPLPHVERVNRLVHLHLPLVSTLWSQQSTSVFIGRLAL